MYRRLLPALVATSFLSTAALAQRTDIVVMRKPITLPTGEPVWKTGPWSRPASCSAVATMTRQVACYIDGNRVDDRHCVNAKPAIQTTFEDYSGCTFDWSVTPYGEWDAACSSRAVRVRSVACTRSDGTKAPDAQCGGARPVDRETGPNYAGCTYAWEASDFGAYDSLCSKTAVHTRTVICRRSDGGTGEPSQCPATKPATSETSDIATGCSYRWEASGWTLWSTTCGAGTRSRTATCARYDPKTSISHVVPGPDASCDPLTKPTTSESSQINTGCAGNLVNGDFETCSGEPWMNFANSPAKTFTGTPSYPVISGRCSVLLTPSTGSTVNDSRIIQIVELVPGSKYTLTLDWVGYGTSEAPYITASAYGLNGGVAGVSGYNFYGGKLTLVLTPTSQSTRYEISVSNNRSKPDSYVVIDNIKITKQ